MAALVAVVVVMPVQTGGGAGTHRAGAHCLLTTREVPVREAIVYWRPGCPFCVRLRLGLRLTRTPHRLVGIHEDPAAAPRGGAATPRPPRAAPRAGGGGGAAGRAQPAHAPP